MTFHMHPAIARAQIMLDKLPEGSVVLDRNNNAWQQSRNYWYRAYGDSSEIGSLEVARRCPVKVLWGPE